MCVAATGKPGHSPRQNSFSAKRRSAFLANLAESSNVSKSAEKAGVCVSQAYRARREDPKFARQWFAALSEGYTHLEMEILRRLRDGDQKGEDSEKYDFANAIRMLNAHRDNVQKAQTELRSVSAAEIRASIDRKIELIRKKVIAEERYGDCET